MMKMMTLCALLQPAIPESPPLESIRVEAGYGTLTIEGNESFSSGDIIRIKDGARDEWMEIKGNLPPLLSMEFSETKLEFMLTVQIRNGQRAQRW